MQAGKILKKKKQQTNKNQEIFNQTRTEMAPTEYQSIKLACLRDRTASASNRQSQWNK